MRRRVFVTHIGPAATLILGAALAFAGAAPLYAQDNTPSAANRAVFWMAGDPGQRLHIRGRVTGEDGRPVAGATVFLWQADGTGVYPEGRYRGTLETAADGSYNVITVLPGQYAGNKHIHVAVNHPAHLPMRTEMLFKGDADPSAADDSLTIALEEAHINEQTVLLGRFDIKLRPL